MSVNNTDNVSNGHKSATKELAADISKPTSELNQLISSISKHFVIDLDATMKNAEAARKKIKGWKNDLLLNFEEGLSDQQTESDKKERKAVNKPVLALQILEKQIQKICQQQAQSTNLEILESRNYLLNKKRKALFKLDSKLKEQGIPVPTFRVRNVFEDIAFKTCDIQERNCLKIESNINRLLYGIFETERRNPLLQYMAKKHRAINFEGKRSRFYEKIGYNHEDFLKIKKYRQSGEVPELGYNYDKVRNTYTAPEVYEIKKRQIENEPVLSETYAEYPEFQYEPGLFKLPQEEEIKAEWCKQINNNIFKSSRMTQKNRSERQGILKRMAIAVIREIQKRYIKCQKIQREHVLRAKRLHRQTLVYWRKREKELIQVKKKKQKLEAELKKRDQEERESVLQVKRLEFLMKQSDLYAHFMAKKLGIEPDPIPQADGKKNSDIDEQAAKLNISEMINQQKENLKRYQTHGTSSGPQKGKINFAEVDQDSFNNLISAPGSFRGILKEYQLKGLRWLDNLYEQGINGILADEMGLGKTIQAIALLAHISENKNVWGPFLVVAPSSTLFNWQQQIKKFCPSLRILPYWGNLKQRKTIRKFFSSKKFIGTPDSPFHIVITSYQLIVTDQKTFQRLKWQYMILDEAQAIKNISSQRWKTLMGFQSRNKLLLTGTPIQNTMAQLWALLHFIMPKLFDSHEQFQQWFSKDIEAHSQDQKALNQHQIQRLHGILKPFMLRRIKKDVEHEIGKKIQHQTICEMTKRQQHLYDSIKQKLNLKEFFKMFESKMKVENLMNLVMQFRKVCNHPELFQRRPSRSPFLFQNIYYYTGHQPIKYGQLKLIAYNSRNPITYQMPKLVYDEIVCKLEQKQQIAKRRFNLHTSLQIANNVYIPNNGFSYIHLMGLSGSLLETAFSSDCLILQIILMHSLKTGRYLPTLSTKQSIYFYTPNSNVKFLVDFKKEELLKHYTYIPVATAPVIDIQIPSRNFCIKNTLFEFNTLHKFALYGCQEFDTSNNPYRTLNPQYRGFMNEVKFHKIQVVDFASLIADSTKLRQLDRILKEKKANGDRVLIFCQMTKMLDILEDFMNKKKYTFFRLDGSLNIADRRDMVNQFQTNPKIFAFLLSTRAGGLGVTLTAANTVIFYDNDWNPTMDAQATDRAHRIGQRSDVHVYRLVTKGTIQERIVKRAQQKQTVQSTVYEGATFKADVFKPQQIIELVFDENEIENDENQKLMNKHRQKDQRKKPPPILSSQPTNIKG